MILFHHGTNDSSSCDSSCLRYFTMMSHMMSLWNVMDAQNPARFLRGIHARLACAKQTAPWMFADAFVIWSGYVSPVLLFGFLISRVTAMQHAQWPRCAVLEGIRWSVVCKACILSCVLRDVTPKGCVWHLATPEFDHSSSTCLTNLDKRKLSTLMDKLHGQIARKGCVNMFN
jgi:hypothetical protein